MTRASGSKIAICICGKWFVKTPGTRRLHCGRCRAQASDKKPAVVEPKPDEHKFFTCENCFCRFQRNESGHRVFCDSCLPWFADDRNASGIDHAAEQAQARKVKPIRHTHRSVESLIDEWMRG